MKKLNCLIGLAITVTPILAQHPADTLKLVELQDVVVKGIQAQKKAPYAVANIKQQELQNFSKTGQELPFLFSQTPGVLAWGENGLGTGTAHLRIRGAAGSRINVTFDGVPLNSPEDQTVFWANMNSYASLLRSAQIQRGIGTSTNGDVELCHWSPPLLRTPRVWNSPVHTVHTTPIIRELLSPPASYGTTSSLTEPIMRLPPMAICTAQPAVPDLTMED